MNEERIYERGRLEIEDAIHHCELACERMELYYAAKGLNQDEIECFEYWENYQIRGWLEELQQYRSIGTLDDFQELVEKQKPKKPTKKCHFEEIGYWIGKCPFCGRDTTSQEEYCSSCGQELDWREEV